MTRDALINEYFEWMYQLVCDNPYANDRSYRLLLTTLSDIDFTYTLPMDGNRADDGIDLRYRFGYECNHSDAMIASYLDDMPCSVLEMMIALAIRCEDHIMCDPDIGDRTGKWFWDMIDSLGLLDMHDGKFNACIVYEIIDIFLNREYERNGKGGLFTVKHCTKDMRSIEIWYQLHRYLDDIL